MILIFWESKMKGAIIATTLIATLTSCTTLWKVTDLNPESKHFPTSKQAVPILERVVDLNTRKELLIVPSMSSDANYFKEMVSKNGFFDEVISVDDLADRIVHAGLGDKVRTIADRIGFSNAAKYYKPFLFLTFKVRTDGDRQFDQIYLIDALTMEDYFIAEILYNPGEGVDDQSIWYPLLNSLNDYLQERSKK